MSYTCEEVACIIIENANMQANKRDDVQPNRNNKITRYSFTDKALKQLLGSDILKQSFINELVLQLESRGWLFIPLADTFILIETRS